MKDRIICGDNVGTLQGFPDDCIDLTVTSPPYDNLRTYGGHVWGWEEFIQLAPELYRVTKPGGVVVWIVNDATVDGSETGTSFKQALHFKECGFRLHDTMAYGTNKAPMNDNRYQPCFEFMFVLAKGRPETVNLLQAKCTYAGTGTSSRFRQADGTLSDRRGGDHRGIIGETKPKTNYWHYATGSGKQADPSDHPAPFPEALARDHILSWSNEGDTVLDPFCGSGTTPKMARLMGRHYVGIEINPEYCDNIRVRLRPKLLSFMEPQTA